MRIPFPYRIARTTVPPLIKRCYRVQIRGMEHLPDRPVVLAANHRSFMDSIFIAQAVGRPMAFLAKAEYFDHPVSKRLLSGLGQIPLRRGSPASARQAVDAACQALVRGWSIAIYPEGTRSRDGKLHRGNTGAARIAQQAQVPLVPVGLDGTEAVQPPGQTVPRPFKPVTIGFGPPIDPPAQHTPAKLREVTDNLVASIGALCNQEYSDEYATPPTSTSHRPPRPRSSPRFGLRSRRARDGRGCEGTTATSR